MPNNKVKTRASLQGKGPIGKSLHPQSRRAKQVIRIDLRTEKLAKAKGQRTKSNFNRVDRHLYFINALEPSTSKITLQDLHLMVQTFLKRHDEDIETEVSQRRPGRPKSSKQTKLEADRERGYTEYGEGFILPDLTDESGVIQARVWSEKHDGDPQFVPRLRLVRLLKAEPDEIVVVQPGVPAHTDFSRQDAMVVEGEEA